MVIFFKTKKNETIKEHWHMHNILPDDQNNNKKKFNITDTTAKLNARKRHVYYAQRRGESIVLLFWQLVPYIIHRDYYFKNLTENKRYSMLPIKANASNK